MLGFMLLQLASLKVGSMRTGYTASASFTTTASMGTVGRVTPCAPSRVSEFLPMAAGIGAHRVTRPTADPSFDLRLVNSSVVRSTLEDRSSPTEWISMREVNSLHVASVTRKRL